MVEDWWSGSVINGVVGEGDVAGEGGHRMGGGFLWIQVVLC